MRPAELQRPRHEGGTNPLNNFLDDITWTKGKHTITTGLNFRFNRNNTSPFTNCVPALCLRRDGIDRTGRRHRQFGLGLSVGKLGNPNLQLANPTAVTNASAVLLGILNDVFVTYQYNKSGQAACRRARRSSGRSSSIRYARLRRRRVPGQPRTDAQRRVALRKFPAALRSATDCRWTPRCRLNQYFAQRNGLQSQGIPANQMSDFTLSYALNGPANGKAVLVEARQCEFRAALRRWLMRLPITAA